MGAFLLSVAGPIALRVLFALGIGTLTFTGVDAAFAALVASVQSNFGGLPADVLKLASLAGIHQCLGLLLGAFNARVGLWVAVGATRFVART